jgi:hypothetical protein
LTPGKSLPAAAEYLIGFGLKYIWIQENFMQFNNIDEGIDCFDSGTISQEMIKTTKSKRRNHA